MSMAAFSSDEPQSTDDIERESRTGTHGRGVNQLWYASLNKSSPPVFVRGEDLGDLRDMIREWIGRNCYQE